MGATGSRYELGRYRVRVVKPLAEGGFSYVDLVYDEVTAQYYALKRILVQSKETMTAAQREVALHQQLSHPFVMSLLAHSIIPVQRPQQVKAHEVLLLFPYYAQGSVVDAWTRYKTYPAQQRAAVAAQHKQKRTAANQRTHSERVLSGELFPFPEHEALRLFYGILQGVRAIHASELAHRDIKPHNIMLSYPFHNHPAASSLPTHAPAVTPRHNSDAPSDSHSPPIPLHPSMSSAFCLASEPQPIIIDLGSCDTLEQTIADRKQALQLQEKASTDCTASYRAPELHSVPYPATIDERADVFSLGCTLFFMAFGYNPFEDEEQGFLTLALQNGKFTFPEQYCSDHNVNDVLFPTATAANNTTRRPSVTSTPAPTTAPNSPTDPDRTFSTPFCTFIRDMLQSDPTKRLTMKQCMKTCVELMTAAVERKYAQHSQQADSTKTHAAGGSSATANGADAEDDFGDFQSSSVADSYQQFSADTLRTMLEDMTTGAELLKFGKNGTPHSCKFHIDHEHLYWKSKRKSKEQARVSGMLQQVFV